VRRIPILATMVVAVAVATMIGLGVWQWQRAGWKDRLLAEYAAAASLPPLDLDPLLARGAEPAPLSFRRALVSCRAERVAPRLRGGRSRDGVGGYVHLVPCRPGASGLAGRLLVNVGWSRMPDEDLRLSLAGIVAGTLGLVEPDERDAPILLTSATALPPLAPSGAPGIEDIPNNHLLYAFQWFFFAAAALVIYWLALRRRLSGAPEDPKSPPS
jgi:surfeit locus 1 family protein